MSTAVLQPSALCGKASAPCSKSEEHRALICSFLAGGADMYGSSGDSEDILATRGALRALYKDTGEINCHASGTTLRFFIPVAAALGKTITFTGEGRLPQRPIDEYLRLLPAHGVACRADGALPLTISGQLQPGRYEVAGDVSSQFVSGLLLALPLLSGESEIVLTTPLQSRHYVEMTLQTMRAFGVEATPTAAGYFVRGRQRYQPIPYHLGGDWSQAALFLVGGALTGAITLTNLNPASAQGDKQIVEILRRFGADITVDSDSVTVRRSAMHGIEIDVSDIPDLAPIIAVAAACAEGTTVITGGARLRLKESDRIAATVGNLQKMGVNAQEMPDGLIIEGGALHGAVLDGCNDHRIVMAFSIAALAADGQTTITDAQSIRKSYPHFFNEYNYLGGKADVVSGR